MKLMEYDSSDTLGSRVLSCAQELWLNGKESACSAGDAGDVGSVPGLGRSLGERNGNPLQYSCLKKFPWVEEPSGLQFMGLQRSQT